MPSPPLDIPAGVTDWIRSVFQQINHRSAATLSRIPNLYETALDFKFPSDWIVNLDTHFIGGGRYWGKWEIADIGILVVFRRNGKTIATKVALLQSKRLYPDEIANPVDMHPLDYGVGFARLLASDSEYRSHVKQRTFHFSPESKYRALEYREEQYEAILKYATDNGIPVHYLLYNPLDIPHSCTLPAAADEKTKPPKDRIACRVINADTLHAKLKAAGLKKSANPSFEQAAGTPMDDTFWTLHNFVADLVLGCKEGYLAGIDPTHDHGLFRVFNERSGPISAAISVTIDAPGG